MESPPATAVDPLRTLKTAVTTYAFGLTITLTNDFVVRAPNLNHHLIQAYIHDSTTGVLVWNVFETNRSSFHCMLPRMCEGTKRIFETPNAGGSSAISEALSFEVLHRTHRAILVDTEMEIRYWPEGSKRTDYSVIMDGHRLGVSVTRAMRYKGEFTREDARTLLEKKLDGVNWSSTNVMKKHKWEKQILHIWAQTRNAARIIMAEYQKMEMSLRSNTVVMVTIAEDADFIFFEAARLPDAKGFPWIQKGHKSDLLNPAPAIRVHVPRMLRV